MRTESPASSSAEDFDLPLFSDCNSDDDDDVLDDVFSAFEDEPLSGCPSGLAATEAALPAPMAPVTVGDDAMTRILDAIHDICPDQLMENSKEQNQNLVVDLMDHELDCAWMYSDAMC